MFIKINKENNNFIISNKLKDGYKNNIIFLFGYCFTETTIIKNREIDINEYNYIKYNRNTLSGIYFVICKLKDKIEVIIDPLVQYNIYYYINNNEITISNNLFKIAKKHDLKVINEDYIKDSILFHDPLCGHTLVKDVYFLQYDDIYNPTFSEKLKKIIPIKHENFTILEMKNDIYNNIEYDELIDIYIKILKRNAEIVSANYDEVYISLTGGADSRLVTSLFKEYNNVYHYCYGNGTRQDRLVSEYIIENFNLKSKKDVDIVGNKTSRLKNILKCIENTNCQKPNLDLYINGKIDKKICNITGYYGANVSGGTQSKFMKMNYTPHFLESDFYKNNYNYFKYYDLFKNKYKYLRNSERADLFYLNNRGLSHYACHSIIDNKYGNSFDILINPINIELVKKCPYSDDHIDSCVISVDIIYRINKELALIPYDNRIIPKYRNFNDIPDFNCFEKHIFDVKPDIKDYNYIRPKPDEKYFGLFENENEYDLKKILNFKELSELKTKYSYLIDSNITDYKKVFILCAIYYLQNYNII
jgi:translation initiation factor 2 beta subunit (eIF-2beta)/eIF-5